MDHYTIKQAAAALKVCKRTIERYIASGLLPAKRFGSGRGRWRIAVADVEAMQK